MRSLSSPLCLLTVACLSTICFGNENAELNAIAARLKPVGAVTVVQTTDDKTTSTAAAAATTPETNNDKAKTIYQTYCQVCHDAGVAGAPKLSDKAQWKKRVTATGKNTLIAHALQGFNAMPPKGTCATCSDEDIKLTVEYMINQE